MLDHIGIKVGDFESARRFYDAALAPLGVTPMMEVTPEQSGGYHGLGYGKAGKPFFWISVGERYDRTAAAHGNGLHVAFAADSRAAVDAFFLAAMASGGRDNGGPGVRPHYHPNYYGAFVLDPDGVNVEAVCHTGG